MSKTSKICHSNIDYSSYHVTFYILYDNHTYKPKPDVLNTSSYAAHAVRENKVSICRSVNINYQDIQRYDLKIEINGNRIELVFSIFYLNISYITKMNKS